MMWSVAWIATLLVVQGVEPATDLFSKYQVIEVGGLKGDFKSEDDFVAKLDLPADDQTFEVLKEDSVAGTAQLLVRPDLVDKFKDKVESYGMSHKVIIEDLQKLIEYPLVSREDALAGEHTFERYMTFAEIQSYLKTIEASHPDRVTLTKVGNSFEGEDITMVTIGGQPSTGAGGKEKPIIFVESGAHAREWISISASIYLMQNLLATAPNASLANEIEFRIIPILNPDGYKFSWSHNRMWRKNRRPMNGTKCYGVDINRNFSPFWNEAGTSSRKCSSVYAGSSAFSEPETQAVRQAMQLKGVKERMKAYVGIHSYGQYVLIAGGYHKYTSPKGCKRLLRAVAKEMSDSIFNATKTLFTYGTVKEVLYPATGGSMDYVFLTEKVPMAFTYELQDKGSNGFLLPNSKIKSAVEDFWVSMKTLSDIVLKPDTLPLSNGGRPNMEACAAESVVV